MSIVVLGTGGHAKVVIASARAAGMDVSAAYDDAPERFGQSVLGVPISGPVSEVCTAGVPAVIAVGANDVRKRLATELDVDWATVIHPAAVVHESAEIGEGSVVFAGAIVQPDSRLGRHTILNTGCTVDHDCVLGDYVHVAPGASLCGSVTVGEGTTLGVGSCVIPGVAIGAWATLGAGATAVAHIADGAVAVGTPAKLLASK